MASSKCLDRQDCTYCIAKGVLLRGTLLLLFSSLLINSVFAHQRDTLQIGPHSTFVENKGQWDGDFRFRALLASGTFFAENHGYTIVLESQEIDTLHPGHHSRSHKGHVYRMQFEKASENVALRGEQIDDGEGYDNYYLGNNPSRWVSNLPHYRKIYYNELYPGIDLDIQMASNALKTTFYIKPDANIDDIVMRYEGVDKIYLSNGNLVLRTSLGEIVELHPYAYQEVDTGRREVIALFRVKDNKVSFRVGEYDSNLPLVIDPDVIFSTYTGSTADNWGTTATYDIYKNTYTAGLVFGSGYPTSTGTYDSQPNGNADIGIFKFDTTGTQRLFATYLGGSYADMPHSLYVNSFDELVLFGTTGSANFPVSEDCYCSTFKGGTSLQYEGTETINFPSGSDIFVSRFSSDGSQLQASTFVGGTGNDGLNYFNRFHRNYVVLMDGNDSLYYNYGDGARGELITDDMNNVYVGSTTVSGNFPTTEGSIIRQVVSGQYGVVFKLDYNLRNMIWSTYLGGYDGNDAVYSIDVDSNYNLLVCGGTTSTHFPTTSGVVQANHGGGSADGFVCKISYSGDQLLASSYYGSDKYDQCYFVRCGRDNMVYLYGQTCAQGSTMVYNANYNVPGSGMFIAKLSPTLDSRIWSTVFGTTLSKPNLSPTAFTVDICNRVYAAGWGRDFVGYNGVQWRTRGTTGMETTTGAISSTTDGQDFYIMSLADDASHLEYATFFGELHVQNNDGGSDHVDGGTSRFDNLGTLYQSVCASCGGHSGFPTTSNAWATTNNSSNCNNALFRFNIHNDFAVADFVTPPVGCVPYTVQFHNIGRGQTFHWDFGDRNTSTQRDPTHTYSQPGTYKVQLIASMDYGCRMSDTTEVLIRVLSSQGTTTTMQSQCNGSPLQIGPRPMLGCTYQWLQGSVTDSSIANPYVTEAGTYILSITATDGCTEIDTFVVQSRKILDSLAIIPPTCIGDSNGMAIAIVPAESRDSIIFIWDGIEGNDTLSGLYADGRVHTLRVEAFGCSKEQPFAINDPPALTVKKEAQTVLCTDSCSGWVHLTYGYPDYPVGDTLVKQLCAGEVTIFFSDTAGCPYSDSTYIIRDSTLDNMNAWADDTVIFLNESTSLHATRIWGVNYNWEPSATLDNAVSPNPIATPEQEHTTYSVLVCDDKGCTWKGSVTIHCTEVICGRPNIYIPNAFSPNGDGINDLLCCSGNYIISYHFCIFSRWGEKVFETYDLHECWDGHYNGNMCLPGVYTYSCQIKCEAGEEKLLKGDITLIR